MRVVIIIRFFPVAVHKVRNDAKHRDPKIVNQLVEHCLLIIAKIGTGVIDAEALNLLILLTWIHVDLRTSRMTLCAGCRHHPRHRYDGEQNPSSPRHRGLRGHTDTSNLIRKWMKLLYDNLTAFQSSDIHCIVAVFKASYDVAPGSRIRNQ